MANEQPKGLWAQYRSIPLMYRIAVAFVLGIIVGLTVGEPIMVIEPLGDLFLQLLSMLIIPIIVFTLIAGMSKLTPGQLGRVGGQTVGIYILTTAIAIIIGLTAANIFAPGVGMELDVAEEFDPAEIPGAAEVFLGIFPENVVQHMAEGDVLPVLVFSIIFGLALAFVKEGSQDERVRNSIDTVFQVVEAGQAAMFKIVWWVLEYAVIGVFALLSVAFAEVGVGVIVEFGVLVLALLVATLVHMILVYYGIIQMGFLKQNPFNFLRGSREAQMTAFVTRSSGGTLPITIKNARDELHIEERVYGFSLPLGATINMDGTAMYQGVAAIFAANLVGVSLTLGEQLTVLVVTVLASVGTAGVPGAGLIMLTMVLTQLGLPLEVVAFVAGIDPILDRIRTWCNVTGDLSVTSLVAKWNDAIDFTKGAWIGESSTARAPGESGSGGAK